MNKRLKGSKKMLRCFCNSESCNIIKSGKHFVLICEGCECKRTIRNPGVTATEYTVSVPLIKGTLTIGEEDDIPKITPEPS